MNVTEHELNVTGHEPTWSLENHCLR